MTRKKKKVSPTNRYSSSLFKVEETVVAIQPKSVPVNLAEEKARFFKTGLTPRFEVQDISKIAELANKTKNQIRFDLQSEAEYILEHVRNEYGDGEFFLEHAFGSRITKEQATPVVLEYLNENSLSESLKIHWCDNLACSAKMVWKGPVLNANRPELRKYSLWINWSDENNYMRESGIKCLMDHEIGTHFFRLINDGFQPWFSDRTRFDLRGMGSFEGQCTEEGLASIHTALRGRVRLLWSPALAYYTACKAAEMSFKELFDHLGRYTSNVDFRWKQVMRVKRGLADPGDLGGFGNDQCYFEGAVKILRNMDKIDFHLLMSGKICMDEIDRIKRVVRRDVIRFPAFMKNMDAYRRTLKKMLVLNGLDKVHNPRCAPAAFTKRLEERKKEGDSPGKTNLKKVRSEPFKALPPCKLKNSFKKSASLHKEKDLKFKGKEKTPAAEVEMFPVSNMFINNFRFKQGEKKMKEQEERTAKLEQSVRSNIVSLDCSISEQIEQLQSIIREHTWSNSDSEYRDSLITEASGDALEVEKGPCSDSKLQDDHSAEIQESESKTICQISPKSSLFTHTSDLSSSLDSDLVPDSGNSLNNFDQPQMPYSQNAQNSDVKIQHRASSSLPDLQIIQKQSPGTGKGRLIRSGCSSARSKLMSKRKVVFPLADTSLIGSAELSQASNGYPSPKSEHDSGDSKSLNNTKDEGGRIESLQELIHKKKDLQEICPNCLSKETGANCLPAEICSSKNSWLKRKKKLCVKIVPLEKLGSSEILKPSVPSSEEVFERILTQPRGLSLPHNNTLSSDTALVKFRMPKIQNDLTDVKSLPPSKKSDLLITTKSSLCKDMTYGKQHAGLKLDSLAKKKYNCCIGVSFTQVNNSIAASANQSQTS